MDEKIRATYEDHTGQVHFGYYVGETDKYYLIQFDNPEWNDGEPVNWPKNQPTLWIDGIKEISPWFYGSPLDVDRE